jgi:hypothetical protein
VGDQPTVGANRAAERLAERLGIDVDRAEIDALAEQGLLPEAGEYKGWPLYDAVDLDELADSHGDLIAAMAAERIAWMEASLHPIDARERLGLRRDEFDKAVAERGLEPGQFGRFAIADVDNLAADDELVDAIRADRCIGPDQAAQYLEIRRTDFDYLELVGLLAAKTTAWMQVGRYRQVPVPLYRVGDLDELCRHPDVGWEALHACGKGDPSPLRELLGARRPPTRAQIIHRFVAELGDRYGVEVWAYYNGATDQWELDWEHLDSGIPTTEQVLAAVTADPVVAQYRGDIKLSTHAGAAIRWARAMLEPGDPRHRDHRPIRRGLRDRCHRRQHWRHTAQHPGQSRDPDQRRGVLDPRHQHRRCRRRAAWPSATATGRSPRCSTGSVSRSRECRPGQTGSRCYQQPSCAPPPCGSVMP